VCVCVFHSHMHQSATHHSPELHYNKTAHYTADTETCFPFQTTD